jgi:hypothetical protein
MPERKAPSGAIRDTANGKYLYDKFQHPLVVKEFARYMDRKRIMSDGSMRGGDNWWTGFPREWLMESMGRHYQDVWLHQKGFGDYADEPFMVALNGLFFNVQAMMLEVLLERDNKGDGDE